jgi:maintenance of mitochondrial morphology protein 1
VPKIAQLIEARLHAWFDERAVEPRFQQIALPSLWPRMRNTRGATEEGGDEDTAILDEEENEEEEDTVRRNGRERDNAAARTRRPPNRERERGTATSLGNDLVARMEEEGRKMREAEEKAGERLRATGHETAGGRSARHRGNHIMEMGAEDSEADWRTDRSMPGGF